MKSFWDNFGYFAFIADGFLLTTNLWPLAIFAVALKLIGFNKEEN